MHTTRHTVALDAIDVPANVRDIDWSHVDGLADSIKLLGVLVPIVLRRQGRYRAPDTLLAFLEGL